MTQQVPQLQPAQAISRAAPHSWWRRLPALFRQHTIFGIAFLVCLFAIVYWSLIASDRYVSEAYVIVQRTESPAAKSKDLGTTLSGGMSASLEDQLLLRSYLLSVDMLNNLNAKLNLRAHYSNRQHDIISRMWSQDEPQEWFYQHYLSRVSVELDDYAGVIVIKAQGYDAKTAHAITSTLVEEGERNMNIMARSLAQEQVTFMQKQVSETAERFRQARRDVVAFQDRKGLVSPQNTAENLAGVVNRLEAQRTDLQTRRNALLGYLSPQASGVVELDLEINAIEAQIAQEQMRLASPKGKPLNATVEEYQRLQMIAQFAEDSYKAALVALEKSSIEATSNFRKVIVVQSPTRPEYAVEPRRTYNIIICILVTLILAGIVHLLATIIRDHKD